MNHTKTPWYVHTTADQFKLPVIVSREGRPVANDGHVLTRIVRFGSNLAPDAANGAHIVRCVNAHDELLAALRDMTHPLIYQIHDSPPSGVRVECVYSSEVFERALALLKKVAA